MSATLSQVGGTHYSAMPYQPIELVGRTNLNFFQGNVLKYLSRHRLKNGRQDILKAIHYCQLGKELAGYNVAFGLLEVLRFATANKMNEPETNAAVAAYHQRWDDCTAYLNEILKKEYPNNP